MCGGGGASDDIRSQQERNAELVSGGIHNVDKVFSGFNPEFYKQRQQAYVNYALPTLAGQYQDTSKRLAFAMANRGLLHSSATGQLGSSLNREMQVQKQNIADQGTSLANQLRQQVGQQKSTIIGQLQASANPGLATQQALESASQLSTPSTFQPVGNLLQGWSNTYLASSLANAYGGQQSTQPNFRSSSAVNVPASYSKGF